METRLSIPKYTTVYHSTPQYIIVHHSTPQYIIVHHSTPQHITVYHSTPQYIIVYHSTPQYIRTYLIEKITHLWHTMIYCGIQGVVARTHQFWFEEVEESWEMVELRGRVVEVYHVKIGPHPTSSPLTHTDVHLSPWLVYLDKNRSNAEGREERRWRGWGRGREERRGEKYRRRDKRKGKEEKGKKRKERKRKGE